MRTTLITLILLFSVHLQAQHKDTVKENTLKGESSIKGEVSDPTGKKIPYLQILLKQDGRVVNGAYSDEFGFYQMLGIPAGTYEIVAGGTVGCSNSYSQKEIHISSNNVKFVNVVIVCPPLEGGLVIQLVPLVLEKDSTSSSLEPTGIKDSIKP